MRFCLYEEEFQVTHFNATIDSYFSCFAVLLIVNETKLFKNDVNYSFDEAVSMQQGKGIVQTKEEDGKFVEANNNEIAKAMTISHKDNDMKYMDITEKCQCRNLKLTNC